MGNLLDTLEGAITQIENAHADGAAEAVLIDGAWRCCATVRLSDLAALPAVLRFARAGQWLRDAERNARGANAAIDAYEACQLGQELEAAREEYGEALAALVTRP